MKKKILVEDIERMVREEVTKRLSEQEIDFKSLPMSSQARGVALNSIYQHLGGSLTGAQIRQELSSYGIDPKKFSNAIESLVFRKWQDDIIDAANASRMKPTAIPAPK